MKTIKLIILLLCNLNYIFSQNLDLSEYETDKVWLKVKPGTKELLMSSGTPQNKLLREVGTQTLKTLFPTSVLQNDNRIKNQRKHVHSNVDLSNYFTVVLKEGVALPLALGKLRASGYFEAVEPVAKVKTLYMPNDEFVDSTSSFNAEEFKIVNAYKAWEVEKGNPNVVIGIADLGVDYRHNDLKDNISYNEADTVDGIDNDSDGYVDNYCGWDFAQNDNDVMSDPQAAPHGTYVASVSSSTPNNDFMLCGSGLYCKFVPLKISSQGAIFIDAAYTSIIYAAQRGVKVINLSWTEGTQYSQIHQDIITKAVLDYDMAVVAAAGNAHREINYYPASYEHVLSVAGSDHHTFWSSATYSNYVDISAPAYLSILTDGQSAGLSAGSSISSPLVAGALGLVRAKFPNLSAIQAMEKLRMAATRLDTISPYTGYKYLFGRRLDMYSALTKEVKSIRMTSFKAASPSGTALLGGDTITLTINLKNYLSPTTVACKAKLKCDSTYIKLVTDEVSIGALSTLQAIESQQFRFIIDKAAPKLVSVKFLLEYFDHDHYDYQVFTIHNININYLDLDTNHITLSITDNGRLGYTNMDANIGSGLQYLGANNSLYEGGLLLSTDEGKLSDCVRNESTQNDDFVSMDHIRYQNSGLAHRHITSTYGDTSASGVHVEVQQNSFAWSDANHRNYVVVEYQLKNTSGEKINKLNAAVFSDWDIPSLGSNDAHAYSKNKVIWDSTNNLSIAYNTLTNGLYVGTRLLTNQKPIYAALDNKNVNGQFTDTEKLRLLSSGVSTLRAGTTTSLGTDISALIGVSISNLAPQETATFALTFIIGTDILNLQDQSRIALDRYRSIRTSAAPEPVSMTVCHDSPVLRSLGGGKKYNFYTSLPLNSNHKIKTDSLIDIPEVSRDTAFYVTNHDDVFESTPSLVKIVVSTYTAEGFTILPIGSGKYLFYTNQAYKNIAWVIDHDTVSKNNNYIHQFTSNGAHTVKLILTSPIDCVDAASKEVFVSEVLTLLVGEIIGDEIEVYPIPTTGDKLYVDIPETMLTHIQASITNLIGVDLGVKYALKPGKNPIDVSHLDHGIYFINIFAYNKVYKYKFIVA